MKGGLQDRNLRMGDLEFEGSAKPTWLLCCVMYCRVHPDYCACLQRGDMHLKRISAESKISDLGHDLAQLGYVGLSPLHNVSVRDRAPKVYLRLDASTKMLRTSTKYMKK